MTVAAQNKPPLVFDEASRMASLSKFEPPYAGSVMKLSVKTAGARRSIRFLLTEKILTYPCILLFITFAYLLIYFHTSYAPGNQFDTQPLGWWAWSDQGAYLKNARNMAQWQFPPGFWYPVLYPALGALFLPLFPGHPYFFLNLACLLWFSYVFLRIGERYFSRAWAVFILLATTICRPQILEQFAVPWTTTLCTALLSTLFLALIWAQDVQSGQRKRLSAWMIFVVSLCLGLTVATRPQDAVIGLVVIVFLFFKWLSLKRGGYQVPGWTALIALAILGGCIGPVLYFGHRYLIAHSFEALYAFSGTSLLDIFPLADIPEKFISLWLDGYPLYGELHSGLLFRLPWLFVGTAGLGWIFLKGDYLTRCLASAIFLSFCFVYIPYFDLLPTGLWTFLNFHYFIWAFPYLGLFGLCLLHAVLVKKKLSAVLLLVGVPLLLLSLHVDITCTELNFKQKGNVISADLPNKEIDFVDLTFTKRFGFTGAYIFEEIAIDDTIFSSIAQTRCLATDKGVRLLFVRPVEGRKIRLTLRPAIGPLGMKGVSGSYAIVLSRPRVPAHQPTPLSSARDEAYLPGTMSPFPMGEKKDSATLEASGILFGSGWSMPEAWGRWTEGGQAEFFIHPSPAARTLVLHGQPLTGGDHTSQRLNVSINGAQVYTGSLAAGEHEVRVPLPDGSDTSGMLRVRLGLPDAFSPRSIHSSDDPRVLGFGLTALSLH